MNKIRIIAIIPAHNEAKGIASSINSIEKYVDKIIVACDNCSDDTYEIAKKAGAQIVFNTQDNHFRKA